MKITEAYTHGIVLAPMAGFTDSAFRRICRQLGATCTVTEMVAAAGLSYRSVKSHKLLNYTEEEKPIGVQLFGNKECDFAKAAAIVTDLGFDFIDINAGCPVKKVAMKGSGAGLLRDISLLCSIVRGTVKASSIPVTVKIRLGWSPDEPVPDYLPACLADEGAAAIAIHGRYRSDFFGGDVNLEAIRNLSEKSNIPVLANGASESVESVIALKEKTLAQGVLVGRGALGNPWIFRGLTGTPEDAEVKPGELKSVVMLQLQYMKEYIPKQHLYHILRGHLMNYIKGFEGASILRKRAAGVSSDDDVAKLLDLAESAISAGLRR